MSAAPETERRNVRRLMPSRRACDSAASLVRRTVSRSTGVTGGGTYSPFEHPPSLMGSSRSESRPSSPIGPPFCVDRGHPTLGPAFFLAVCNGYEYLRGRGVAPTRDRRPRVRGAVGGPRRRRARRAPARLPRDVVLVAPPAPGPGGVRLSRGRPRPTGILARRPAHGGGGVPLRPARRRRPGPRRRARGRPVPPRRPRLGRRGGMAGRGAPSRPAPHGDVGLDAAPGGVPPVDRGRRPARPLELHAVLPQPGGRALLPG